MTITEFLLARIAEDEEDAEGAIGQHWDGRAFQQVRTEDGDTPGYYKIASGQVSLEHWEPRERLDPGTMFSHMARHDPARVLAECAAKRAIIGSLDLTMCPCSRSERCVFHDSSAGPISFARERYFSVATEVALKSLAAIYADDSDYRKEWAL